MRTTSILGVSFALAGLVGATAVSAHVIVTPDQVGIGVEQTFSMSVPSERDFSTTAVRLLIPGGLTDVFPTVQTGWTISTKLDSNNDVTEIDWTAGATGAIPTGERDDFTFRGQAPAAPTSLDWKAYQTYSDGTVISWDQTPVPGHADDDSMTPYSVTKVVNDLTNTPSPTNTKDTTARNLSIAGIILAVAAIALTFRRRQ